MRNPEPARPGQGGKPPTRSFGQMRSWRFWLGLGLVYAASLFITNVVLSPNQPKSVTIPYNQFKDDDSVVVTAVLVEDDRG